MALWGRFSRRTRFRGATPTARPLSSSGSSSATCSLTARPPGVAPAQRPPPASRPGEGRGTSSDQHERRRRPPPASRRSGIPTTTAHPATTAPAAGERAGSRRAASSPTAAPATKGQAVATVPASAEPSSWDRRPSRTNTSTASRSAIKVGVRASHLAILAGSARHRTAWQDRWVLTVATVNVNGVRAAVRGHAPWLAERAPDVLCLQEVRATDADLAAALGDGWFLVHEEASARGRAGVAVATRTPPVDVRAGLAPLPTGRPGDAASTVPAGGSRRTCRRRPSAHRRLGLRAHGRGGHRRGSWRRGLPRWQSAPAPTVWPRTAGTSCSPATSTSPTARTDLKNWKGNLKKSGFLPQERACSTGGSGRRLGRRRTGACRAGPRALHVVVLARTGLRQRLRLADRLPARLRPARRRGPSAEVDRAPPTPSAGATTPRSWSVTTWRWERET